MQTAIVNNPFKSSHFVWMDFAINHVAKDTHCIHEWMGKVPDKIRQMCINPFVEKDDPRELFHNIYHHTAGGLFSGRADMLLRYCGWFRETVKRMLYQESWFQIDEAVMSMVQRQHPECFDLYFGDYEGIVANYVTPRFNQDLILQGLQKCLAWGETKKAGEIQRFLNQTPKKN